MNTIGQPVTNIFGQVCAVSTGATITQMRRFIRLCQNNPTLASVLESRRDQFLRGMADEGREAFLATLERYYPAPAEVKEPL